LKGLSNRLLRGYDLGPKDRGRENTRTEFYAAEPNKVQRYYLRGKRLKGKKGGSTVDQDVLIMVKDAAGKRGGRNEFIRNLFCQCESAVVTGGRVT